MKIVVSEEIRQFFSRCEKNIAEERKNSFLGRRVTPENERQLRALMREAGIPEFAVPEDRQPSLWIRTKKYLESPYHSHVRPPRKRVGKFSYQAVTIQAGELFNADQIQKDPRRELNDWMRLRALDEPYEALFLMEGERAWMMDTPSEALTNDPHAQRAHGRVLAMGLGIGYFPYMALLNPKVESVTVIERSGEVIELFEGQLRRFFPPEKKMKIVQDDAANWFNQEKMEEYDFVYVDLWHAEEDGLRILSALLEQYVPPLEKAEFWIEDSIMETVWTMSFLVLREAALQKKAEISEDYRFLRDKAERYFGESDEVIRDVSSLKERIYDSGTLRRVLGTHAGRASSAREKAR